MIREKVTSFTTQLPRISKASQGITFNSSPAEPPLLLLALEEVDREITSPGNSSSEETVPQVASLNTNMVIGGLKELM